MGRSEQGRLEWMFIPLSLHLAHQLALVPLSGPLGLYSLWRRSSRSCGNEFVDRDFLYLFFSFFSDNPSSTNQIPPTNCHPIDNLHVVQSKTRPYLRSERGHQKTHRHVKPETQRHNQHQTTINQLLSSFSTS